MASSATAKPAAALAAESDEAPAKGKKPILLFGGIGLVVALLAVGGWFVAPRLLGWQAAPHAEVKKEPPPVKVTVPLGAVVVNVGSPERRRYLKIAVEFGLPSAKESKEIEEKKPQITDLLISVLTTMPLDALGSEDGRVELKKTLLERMHEELGLEHVSRVYFTEFVIQ